jgi:hypothetical protein
MHDVTSQETEQWVFIAVRTSDLIPFYSLFQLAKITLTLLGAVFMNLNGKRPEGRPRSR